MLTSFLHTFLKKKRSAEPYHTSGAAALHSAAACAMFIAVVFLIGCPKKQWSYTPPPPAPTPTKEFDVVFDRKDLDPNGAPRNVDWAPQTQGRIPNPDACNNGQPYSSACTQNKPFPDQPDLAHEAFCFLGKITSGSPPQLFFGHADWTVAQYSGSIGWLNFATDSDHNLVLVPDPVRVPPPLPQLAVNEHGVTTNNNYASDSLGKHPYIELEWDSDETDDAFSVPSTWWARFNDAAYNHDAQELRRLLHPSDQHTLACGTVVGLFGLDCDHGCRSEVHPVYALAIQRTEDRTDNEWSVLVRNWGTGGYCSQYNDELATTSLSLVLPYSSSQPPTNVEVQEFVTTAVSGAGVACPKFYFQNGQTILNLTLPPPEDRGVAAFSLKIQWPDGATPGACTKVTSQELMEFTLESQHPVARPQGEDYLEALVRGASQGRPLLNFKKDILPAVPASQARMNALPRMTIIPPIQTCNGSIPVIAGPPPPAPAPAVRKLRKDAVKQVRDDALRTYICQQYRTQKLPPPAGTSQQDLDRACKGVK
jgi:hypothetical protein